MKWIVIFGMLMMASFSFAQTPAAPAPVVATASPSPTPPPVAAPAAPAPAVQATVQVAASAAPPAWVQDLLSTISGLPIVGPWVSTALVYLQALGGLLTALVAFLLAISAALKGVVNFSGLTTAVTWIETFQQSKIMYWLTSLSNIPVHITPAQAAAPPSGQAPPAATAAT